MTWIEEQTVGCRETQGDWVTAGNEEFSRAERPRLGANR